jgi:predicted metal-dependent peptidase
VVPEEVAGSAGEQLEVDASCGSGCDGIARPFDLPACDEAGAVDPGHGEALRREVAIGFREHCRSFGSTPGQWGRWVADILDPVVPWQQVLQAAVRRGVAWGQGHTDYTYSRISRRQAAAGRVVLPALRRPVPAVAIVIDTSGSVDDGLLAQALGEVDGVLSSMAVGRDCVTTMAVDAAVHTTARVRDARSVPLAGGGGTDMGVGIAAAPALRPPAQLVVVLTDGFTPWPEHPPGIPVIAALLGRDRAELPTTPWWAQRVEVVERT